jgi:hypothetical protein
MDGELDWYQTLVFVDLPLSLPVGETNIYIEDPDGNYAQSSLNLVPGTGAPNSFDAEGAGQLTRQNLAALERSSYYALTFSGSTVPYAIQLELGHDPDKDAGGVGKAYAVNPISGLKTVSWHDAGGVMKIVMMPASSAGLSAFRDFRLYLAGGIQNVSLLALSAFDAEGNPVSGVNLSIEANEITLTTSN